ncbi:hypothetical protein N825_01185 [Skermanella stibiiresistens SB22]|uniref:Methyltransferase type 11 domain-containing protein n=2 Tax=Skermanella TaxID=204447 RepID=W9HDN2_9PROT|nr:hypothetical protein N825_01185 [Skermanella stibiiresistens SB22]
MKVALGQRWIEDLLRSLMLSQEFLQRSVTRAAKDHLYYIHQARCKLIRTHLPPAAEIGDLGGANAPIYHMGYPHKFDRLVMVDLPDEQRHTAYGQIKVQAYSGPGEVVVHYGSMVNLTTIPDGSLDLVWSGQSIEHVSEADGQRMCAEVNRVLKPGGMFCLDTPNGRITNIHAATAGLKFIHPEHFIEYDPDHLASLLTTSGFEIVHRYGVCHMPTTARTGIFSYEDFVLGSPIVSWVEESYIQYYACRKI